MGVGPGECKSLSLLKYFIKKLVFSGSKVAKQASESNYVLEEVSRLGRIGTLGRGDKKRFVFTKRADDVV